MYEDIYNPVYDASNAKKAYGAASAGTDRNASTFFYAPRAVKARGSVMMHMARADEDPQIRDTVIGFTMSHLVIPKKNTGFVAIVSDDV